MSKEFMCSASGEQNLPVGAILVSAPIRACVRWMSAGTWPVPSRCGAN